MVATVKRGAAHAERHDVVICGGGLAGQTIARQLRQRLPDASIVIVEPTCRPLPDATFKVGESTVEVAAFYLADVLRLADHLEASQLRKLGLRFFFGDPTGPFHERPEFGLSEYPVVTSYQIDRGRFEHAVRTLNEDHGVVLLEGHRVVDVDLASGPNAHGVHIASLASAGRPTELTLRARWVLDATGRRRLLSRKLGLLEPGPAPYSAAWFRVPGRADVGDLVAPDRREWHERVPDGQRYYSTNHLMGSGYWVWLIPLSSGCTSIGIVADERLHPFAGYHTHDRAREWLAGHEPALAAYLGDQAPLDFHTQRHYSHRSRQVISEHRWACVGDAGFFADPFYSPGTFLIAFGNSIVTDVVAADLAGHPPGREVTAHNRWLRGVNDLLTTNTQRGYPFFGRAMPMAAKLLWDFAAQWGYLAPQMFNRDLVVGEAGAAFRRATSTFFFLQRRMQRLFEDWADRSTGTCRFEFFDYLALPFLRSLRARNLQTGKSPDELTADAQHNMDRFEELAQVLFLVAVADVLPDESRRFDGSVWLDAWSVSLDPSRWDADGLDRPRSPRRDLAVVGPQVFAAFGLPWNASRES